jgi:hypothetical protein
MVVVVAEKSIEIRMKDETKKEKKTAKFSNAAIPPDELGVPGLGHVLSNL